MAAWESAPKSAACFSAMTLIMTSEMNCEEGERKKEEKKKKTTEGTLRVYFQNIQTEK